MVTARQVFLGEAIAAATFTYLRAQTQHAQPSSADGNRLITDQLHRFASYGEDGFFAFGEVPVVFRRIFMENGTPTLTSKVSI